MSRVGRRGLNQEGCELRAEAVGVRQAPAPGLSQAPELPLPPVLRAGAASRLHPDPGPAPCLPAALRGRQAAGLSPNLACYGVWLPVPPDRKFYSGRLRNCPKWALPVLPGRNPSCSPVAVEPGPQPHLAGRAGKNTWKLHSPARFKLTEG